MAQYHITVNDELLHGLFTRDEGLAKLLEQVLNPILEAQVEEQLGARRDERTEERKRLSKRFVSTPADNPGGTVDLARSTDQRWGVLHRTVSTISTKRTSSGTGINGNGGERGVYLKNHPNHGGVVWDFVFQVDGLLAMQRARSDDPRLESPFPS